MSTPDYTQKLKELRSQVNQHAKLPNPNGTVINLNFSNTIPNSLKFYAIPPIGILILLVVFKPSFVTTNHIDKDNVITKKMDFKKLIIYVLIGGTIVNIGLFVYFRKHKSE